MFPHFRFVVTTGNEAGLSAFEVADYLLDEGGTEVFVMFLEAIRAPEQLAAELTKIHGADLFNLGVVTLQPTVVGGAENLLRERAEHS